MDRGSIKDKITHPALLKERAGKDFNKEELTYYFSQNFKQGPKRLEWFDLLDQYTQAEEIFKNKPEWYGWTTNEKMNEMYKRMQRVVEISKDKNIILNFPAIFDMIYL
jgi:hypothetical protein